MPPFDPTLLFPPLVVPPLVSPLRDGAKEGWLAGTDKCAVGGREGRRDNRQLDCQSTLFLILSPRTSLQKRP